MKPRYDWSVIERYFINSGHESDVSLKTVSEKFNIPYATVRRYAAKHDWHRRRWLESLDNHSEEGYGVK